MSSSTINTQLQLNDGLGNQVPISTGTWVTKAVNIEEQNLLSVTVGIRGPTGTYSTATGGFTGTVYIQTTNELNYCCGATGTQQAGAGSQPGLNGYSGAQYWTTIPNTGALNITQNTTVLQQDYYNVGARYVRAMATGLQGSGTIDLYLTAKNAPGGTVTLPIITGLIGWWRGDLGLTFSGNTATWLDQSGQGNTLSGIVGTTTLAGKPAINFNGSQYMQFANTISTLSSGGTYIIVYQLSTIPTSGNSETLLGIKTSGTSFGMYAVIVNVGGYQTVSFEANTSGSAVLSSGYAQTLDVNPHVWIIGYNGSTNSSTSSYSFNLDSITETVIQSGNIGRTVNDLSTIGGNITNGFVETNGLQGSIAEIQIYNTQLTATQIAQLNAYLLSRYGV